MAPFDRGWHLNVEWFMSELPEYVGSLPNICGAEPQIAAALRASRERPVFLPEQVFYLCWQAGLALVERVWVPLQSLALYNRPVCLPAKEPRGQYGGTSILDFSHSISFFLLNVVEP